MMNTSGNQVWDSPSAHAVADGATRAAANGFVLPAGPSCPACGSTESPLFLRSRDWFYLRAQSYELRRCAACHLAWLENAPSPEEMAGHYGADYDKMITTPGDIYPHHWDVVRNKLLQYAQRGSILDIGCSSGSFLRTLKGDSWKLYGIEMSPLVAGHARATTGAEVFVGDVLDATFAAGQLDAVTGFHVLEHMHDPRRVMERVCQWLKPGGIFTVTLPNIDSMEARIFGRYWFGLDTPRHLWQFSPKALAAMASAAGLIPVEVGTTKSCYLEGSARNLLADARLRLGLSPTPPAAAKPAGTALRLVQKAFRLTVVYPFREVAVAAGAGADLHAVFRKPGAAV